MSHDVTNENALDELVIQALVLHQEDAPSRESAARQLLKMRELFQKAFALGAAAAAAEKAPCSPEEKAELLARPVYALELSTRTSNLLQASNIHTVADLLARSESDLGCVPNMGRKSLTEVREVLVAYKLFLPAAAQVGVFMSDTFAEKVRRMPSNVVAEYTRAAPDAIFLHTSLCGQVLQTLSVSYGLSYHRTLRTIKHYIQQLPTL